MTSLPTRDSLQLARHRLAAASNGITARWLAAVVDAIRERRQRQKEGGLAENQWTQLRCHVIPNGRPVTLPWSTTKRKFLRGAKKVEGQPVLTLLGPSEALVKKHRDKLPAIETLDMRLLKLIPIEGITPSNQLSSLFRIDHKGQRILITGDAGCVDYTPSKNAPFYPDLVAQFAPLHVVQVAHHAGHNAYFYRVLLESVSLYEGRHPKPYLILSHEPESKSRPSEVFAQFIGELRNTLEPRLLSTSKPKPKNVEGFEELYHETVGFEEERTVGDVRLVFGRAWTVKRHAIATRRDARQLGNAPGSLPQSPPPLTPKAAVGSAMTPG